MLLVSSGFPLHRCCITCSPTLTGMFVVFMTGMFVVFLTVDDLHFLGVLVFGCVAICNGSSRQARGFDSSVAV